jgi:hypothetical protein
MLTRLWTTGMKVADLNEKPAFHRRIDEEFFSLREGPVKAILWRKRNDLPAFPLFILLREVGS